MAPGILIKNNVIKIQVDHIEIWLKRWFGPNSLQPTSNFKGVLVMLCCVSVCVCVCVYRCTSVTCRSIHKTPFPLKTVSSLAGTRTGLLWGRGSGYSTEAQS